MQITAATGAQQRQRRHPAERVPAVRLQIGCTANAALVRLAAGNPLHRAGEQSAHVGRRKVRQLGHGNGTVDAADVRLTAHVHQERTAGRAHLQQKVPQLLPVNRVQSPLGADQAQRVHRRIGGRQMGQLAGAAAEAAGRAATVREERDHLVEQVVVEAMAEQRAGVQDPVDQPWPAAVQALVRGGQLPQSGLDVAHVLGTMEGGQVRIEAGQPLEAFVALSDGLFDDFLDKQKYSGVSRLNAELVEGGCRDLLVPWMWWSDISRRPADRRSAPESIASERSWTCPECGIFVGSAKFQLLSGKSSNLMGSRADLQHSGKY